MVHKPVRIEITKEELMSRMPRGVNHKVTDSIMDTINGMEDDIDLDQSMMEEQLLQSLHLLSGKNTGTLDSYIKAVKFVNLKRFMSNKEAWSIVFREKYNKMESEGRSVDNSVSMYNSTYFVTELDKKLLIAPSLQYNHAFHEMVANGLNLARGISTSGNTVTPMVQMQAVSKMLDVLAPPEAQQIDISIGMNDDSKSVTEGLTEQLKRMTDMQMGQLAAGVDISKVQRIGISAESIIDTEVDE